MTVEPVTLSGAHVRLEPLTPVLLDDLWAVADHASLWRYMPFWPRTRDELATLMEQGLEACAAGVGLTFVQRAMADQSIVGSTSYLAVDATNRRLEIGATWVTPSWQRTAINTEAKYLLLRHAFEARECIRVEFKTDARNEQSQRALERIGATREGTLRHHIVMPDGYLRDSVYYSVLAEEWPAVAERLRAKLQR